MSLIERLLILLVIPRSLRFSFSHFLCNTTKDLPKVVVLEAIAGSIILLRLVLVMLPVLGSIVPATGAIRDITTNIVGMYSSVLLLAIKTCAFHICQDHYHSIELDELTTTTSGSYFGY